MINESTRTGATSELLVELDVVRMGFVPSRPSLPARYDLLVDDGKHVWRVQTKTGRYETRNGTLKASWDAPYGDDVDVIAVVEPSAGLVYYVPVDKLAKDTLGVTLRFVDTPRDSTSLKASDVSEWPYKAKEENE